MAKPFGSEWRHRAGRREWLICVVVFILGVLAGAGIAIVRSGRFLSV
jgi:hypothetical protein